MPAERWFRLACAHHDERAGKADQGAVAQQRYGAKRRRASLAETAAILRSPSGERDGKRNREQQQQDERAQRTHRRGYRDE